MDNDILQLGYKILETQFKISDGRITDQEEINQHQILLAEFKDENPNVLKDKFEYYQLKN